MMKTTLFVTTLFLGISLMLSSCSKPPASQPELGYTQVILNTHDFNPSAITINKGDTVKWVSHDGEEHTITNEDPGLFNTIVPPWGSFSYTFNQTGDYEYFCAYMSQLGMSAVVHVK